LKKFNSLISLNIRFASTKSSKVAIKKIPKAFEDLVDAKRIFREIKLLNFFNHENIITLLDIQKPLAKTN
jgi:mitogen-activated protein kinase 1/3